MSTSTDRTDRLARSDRWADRFRSLLGTPALDGNRVDILRNGDAIFPAMLEEIDAAEDTVDLVTFVYWEGDIAQRFAAALSGAARRGCRVRVLLDAVGARDLQQELVDDMQDAGCDVRWFRPLARRVPRPSRVNHRTHRKLLICDARVGFTGGVGIADEWAGDARNEHEWRDTHLRIEGPAVAGLQAGFIDNWADEDDDGFDPAEESVVGDDHVGTTTLSVIRGSAETGASEMWRLFLTMISCAEHSVNITTAYFNPDERLRRSLRDAVARGVAVTVMLPGQHADKRFVQLAGEATYSELLEAGVDIRSFETSMLHAKVVTVDGAVATVGSANFNGRSTQFDEETNVVLFDPDIVGRLDADFATDLESTQRLDPSQWSERGRIQRLGEAISEAVSRWL